MTKAPVPRTETIKIVRGRSREVSITELKNKSASIINRLTESDDFLYADKIFMYLSYLPEIVNTRLLIDFAEGCGKSVFLPRPHLSEGLRRFQFTSYDDLVKDTDGFYMPRIGIEEDLSDIDLIIVPCMAVSLFGQLVGYGKTNYSTILRNNFALKYTLAYEFQVFHRIEYSRKDILIDKIITERRIINTREN
jgi:5,10-methenyltetrahydrofolate synthetase